MNCSLWVMGMHLILRFSSVYFSTVANMNAKTSPCLSPFSDIVYIGDRIVGAWLDYKQRLEFHVLRLSWRLWLYVFRSALLVIQLFLTSCDLGCYYFLVINTLKSAMQKSTEDLFWALENWRGIFNFCWQDVYQILVFLN